MEQVTNQAIIARRASLRNLPDSVFRTTEKSVTIVQKTGAKKTILNPRKLCINKMVTSYNWSLIGNCTFKLLALTSDLEADVFLGVDVMSKAKAAS